MGLRNRAGFVFVQVLALLLIGVSSISAHSELERCSPAPNAVLKAPPTEIRCTFSGSVVLDRSTLAVFDAGNNQVDNKNTQLDPADEDDMTLFVTLNTAKMLKGVYRVQWAVVAEADGDRTTGEWTFSLDLETGAGTGTPTTPVVPPPGSSGNPPASVPGSSGTPATGEPKGPAEAPPAAVLPPPGPSASDLPEGKGGVWARNYWGLTLNFTLGGTEYQIPANDDLFVILDPARYPYSANVFGADDTEVMAEAEVKAGQITELGFFLTVKRSAPEEGGEEEGGGEE